MRIENTATAMQNVNMNAEMNAVRQKWAEKLGSGQDINRASDDPAGLAISEKMRGEIKSLSQVRTNYQDTVAFLNTADGAMSQINNNLNDMQKYATQMQNPFMNADNQAIIKAQMQASVDAITNTLDNSKINGIDLFAENSTSGMTQEFVDGLRSLSADSSLDDIRAQVDNVSGMRGTVGSKVNEAEANVRNVANQLENLVASESQIRDTNMAEAYANWGTANILSSSSNAMLSHSMISAQNVTALLR